LNNNELTVKNYQKIISSARRGFASHAGQPPAEPKSLELNSSHRAE